MLIGAYALSNNAHTFSRATRERERELHLIQTRQHTQYTHKDTFTCLHLAKWIHGSTARRKNRTSERTNGRTKKGDWEGDPCVCVSASVSLCVRIRLCVNSVVLAYIHMQHSTAICESESVWWDEKRWWLQQVVGRIDSSEMECETKRAEKSKIHRELEVSAR